MSSPGFVKQFRRRATGDGYDFTATTRFDRLFSGLAVERPTFMPPYGDRTGLEHLTAEDTFDADYGRLLERMQNGNVLPER